jgi:signal transduction histidine kinase
MVSVNELPLVDEQDVKQVLWQFAQQTENHALLLLDAEGHIVWTNPGAQRILNLFPTSILGENFSRFFIPSDIARGIPSHELQVALQTGSAADDRWMERADSSRFWASGVTVHLGAEHGACRYLKIFRDLTESKMHFEGTRTKSRQATEAREDAGAAIALLAHELRNPLTGVSLAAELLQLKGSHDKRSTALIDSIAQNTRHAARLVDDLMQHSKINASGYELEPTTCTLRELLEDSLTIARQQAGQPDRVISLILPEKDIEISVDRMRMQQVFVNLAANAIRYTPLPGRMWVTGTVEGSDAVVRVVDEGIGIEPDILGDLFEAFTGSRIKGSKLGLGLGLAVVKKIVDLHGGSVQARSEGQGTGSQFIARFPLTLPDRIKPSAT